MCLIDLNWFLRWVIWSMGLLLVMQTLRGVKRNYVGPLKIQWLANSSKRIFYLFEWFYNYYLICSIDLLFCKNELLLCQNKENFSLYLASLCHWVNELISEVSDLVHGSLVSYVETEFWQNYVGPLKKNYIVLLIRPNESFIC